jgi:D-glycero-alpha-D-manno-heptose-7-phosphate kinase
MRISFVGGGTDFGDFYRSVSPGAVVSAAINKWVYVTVKRHSPLFDEPIRLNYSETEMTGRVQDIKNDIARACLELLEIEPPIYISTIADLPAASGLGSSSAFAVGLLNALHGLRGEEASAGQLAAEACKVELEILKKPIGKQDQFAAAYGGLNYIRFHSDERVSVSPIRLPHEETAALFQHVLLFWTGVCRSSSSVLSEQKQNLKETEVIDSLTKMCLQAEALRESLGRGFDPHAMGRLLDETWSLKRRLARGISSSRFDKVYECGRAAGALGGKLCGAGGGGFMMFLVEREKQEALCEALSEFVCVRVELDSAGSRILFPNN